LRRGEGKEEKETKESSYSTPSIIKKELLFQRGKGIIKEEEEIVSAGERAKDRPFSNPPNLRID